MGLSDSGYEDSIYIQQSYVAKMTGTLNSHF